MPERSPLTPEQPRLGQRWRDVALVCAAEPRTVPAIARALGVQSGSIQSLIGTMKREDLLEEVASEARGAALKLTRRGRLELKKRESTGEVEALLTPGERLVFVIDEGRGLPGDALADLAADPNFRWAARIDGPVKWIASFGSKDARRRRPSCEPPRRCGTASGRWPIRRLPRRARTRRLRRPATGCAPCRDRARQVLRPHCQAFVRLLCAASAAPGQSRPPRRPSLQGLFSMILTGHLLEPAGRAEGTAGYALRPPPEPHGSRVVWPQSRVGVLHRQERRLSRPEVECAHPIDDTGPSGALRGDPARHRSSDQGDR
jgi:hypothetical protein